MIDRYIDKYVIIMSIFSSNQSVFYFKFMALIII